MQQTSVETMPHTGHSASDVSPGSQQTCEPRPGPDPKEPAQPRVPPSEPADAWALEQARLELKAWRERAERAQEHAASGERRSIELEASLATAREALEELGRSRRIDQELFDEGTIDLEAARLLTEVAVRQMEKPDVARAIRDLRRRKPFLFRGRGMGTAVGTAATPGEASPPVHQELDDASEDAKLSGDRMALLRYLRVKRGV